VADTLDEAKAALMKRYEKVKRRNSLNKQSIAGRLVGWGEDHIFHPTPRLAVA
jgi:hypothetical protein